MIFKVQSNWRWREKKVSVFAGKKNTYTWCSTRSMRPMNKPVSSPGAGAAAGGSRRTGGSSSLSRSPSFMRRRIASICSALSSWSERACCDRKISTHRSEWKEFKNVCFKWFKWFKPYLVLHFFQFQLQREFGAAPPALHVCEGLVVQMTRRLLLALNNHRLVVRRNGLQRSLPTRTATSSKKEKENVVMEVHKGTY